MRYATMTVLMVFVLCLVLVECSSVRVVNNQLFKFTNALSIPGGVTSVLGESVGKGAENALKYCENVFKWDRWNCPASFFFDLQQQPNREAAFSKAMLAAGIVHAITRECSRGEISECGCNPELGPPSMMAHSDYVAPNSTEETEISTEAWGGCSDDPRFAIMTTKKIFDSLEKGNQPDNYVARHNYKIGREMVASTVVKKCRCHGISGNCSMKTCWLQMSSLAALSKKLKDKYKKAERLTYEAIEGSVGLGNSARDLLKEKVIPTRKNSLVYLMQSPDYCISNFTKDYKGTRGRQCLKSSSESASISEKKSCRTLCRDCGYKVKKITKTETRQCNCKFVWCCEVKCETCVVDVQEFFCE